MANVEKRKRLGEILITAGLITEESLQKALGIQKSSGRRLGEVLLGEGFVTEEQVMKVLETQLGIRSLDLSKFYVEPEAAKMVPENLCRKYSLIGVQCSGGHLLIAMKDPLDYFALEDIKLITPLPVKQAMATEKDINQAIERFFSKSTAEKAVLDFVKQYNYDSPKQTKAEIESVEDVNSAPIVRFINSIIENAVRNHASDIHLEPEEFDLRVRIRVDGILQETMRTGLETLNPVVSRIKIMANLNIAEKRLPQDGRIGMLVDNRKIDLRISTLPGIYGEKVVMRILDRSNFVLSKEKLGLLNEDTIKFNRLIEKPYGIVLVTGPTGSGKTSTLYAMLSELNDVKKNIITLEDPVEYNLKGITQVQLNTKAGLNFATGLRSILRQDPDIIMVGEIRDAETAEIAVRSALTGHLVLSTLHTNDAPGAISRIVDMGIEPFLISSSVIGVVAQRLVRKICPNCKEVHVPDDREMHLLSVTGCEVPIVYRGKRCQLCNHTGYKGRIAIFEIMEADKTIRGLIDKRATTDEIRDAAIKNGMLTLRDNCRNLVLGGITTIEELVRVTFSY